MEGYDSLTVPSAVIEPGVSTPTPGRSPDLMPSLKPLTITLAVQQVYRGQVGRRVRLLVETEARSCTYRFKAAEFYLVEAYTPRIGPARLWTAACTLTMPLADADDVLSLLPAGAVPATATPAPGLAAPGRRPGPAAGLVSRSPQLQ
jgi:hypothetical protein